VGAVLGTVPDCLAIWLFGSRAYGYAAPDDNDNVCVAVPDGRDTPELTSHLDDAGMGPMFFRRREMRFTVLNESYVTKTTCADGLNGRIV
jgi:hypothetical protein